MSAGTEYIKGARYRVTFEGTWEDPNDDSEGLSITDQWKFYPGYILETATSVEKIADPTPEWLPGDKVLRDGTDIAIYRGNDKWDVFYDASETPRPLLSRTVLVVDHEVLVKQGKRVVQ